MQITLYKTSGTGNRSSDNFFTKSAFSSPLGKKATLEAYDYNKLTALYNAENLDKHETNINHIVKAAEFSRERILKYIFN